MLPSSYNRCLCAYLHNYKYLHSILFCLVDNKVLKTALYFKCYVRYVVYYKNNKREIKIEHVPTYSLSIKTYSLFCDCGSVMIDEY